MNEKIDVREAEGAAEELELIDLGDAAVETKQPHPFQIVQDSSISWTYFGL